MLAFIMCVHMCVHIWYLCKKAEKHTWIPKTKKIMEEGKPNSKMEICSSGEQTWEKQGESSQQAISAKLPPHDLKVATQKLTKKI